MSKYNHEAILKRAIQALHDRTFFAQYPEHPSPKIYGENADSEGQAWFKNQLGNKFNELSSEGATGWIGAEVSPYLQEPLNVQYPQFKNEYLIEQAELNFHLWRKISVEDRANILIESLERLKNRFFEVCYATMHTTGQGYMMAFQASGPHAADRALEAVAAGYEEITRFPKEAFWDKPMGKFNIQLNKEWRTVPKGIGLVIGCSTFPTWNSVPGVYASLVTGNSVIVKPHPGAVLPMAIVVAELQNVLEENDLPRNIVQLAVDHNDRPIAKELAEHEKISIIDFTGNAQFGGYLESLKGKSVFTEKTGVNSAILDSTTDADKMVANLAFSVSLYSGQMCTAPQNIFIPEGGVETPEGKVSFDDIAAKFIEQINGLVNNPKAGPFVLGAIQNSATCDRVEKAEKLKGKVLLDSSKLENPMFKDARTATPVLMEVDANQENIFDKELFGPIAILVRTKNTYQSLEIAQKMAKMHGAISCAAYCTNDELKERIKDQMSLAAAPVSFNLMGGIYVNQHAAFSDYHVTGGNPAGNASFTDPSFVLGRFTRVGFREPA